MTISGKPGWKNTWKRNPGKLKAGSGTDALTSFTDVLPTLISLAGGEPDRQLDGKSMIGILDGRSGRHHRYVYTTHTNRGIYSGLAYPVRGVRDKRFKYIRNLAPDSTYQNILTHGWNFREEDASKEWASWMQKALEDPEARSRVDFYRNRPLEELYDLRADPWELNNLAGNKKYSRIKSKLGRELDSWMEQQGDEGLATELQVPLKFREIPSG